MSALHRARIKAIHVAKASLGLADADYRDLLQRITGHRSASDCTTAQLGQVVEALRERGARFGKAA